MDIPSIPLNATLPLVGTELLEISQDGVTKKIAVSDFKGNTTWIAPTFTFGTNYGSGHATLGYKKDGNEFVHLKGLVTSIGAAGREIFPLPVGYRPVEVHIFTCLNNSNTAVCRVDVNPGGSVTFVGGPSVSGWVSLAGITFPAEA